MDDLKREKEVGVDFDYLSDVLDLKKDYGDRYQTPGFGLAAQLFCSIAKSVIEKLGPEDGEALLKEAVEFFGLQRGKRIAEKVKAEGKSPTFKNWLIYTDIDSINFRPAMNVEDGDCVAKIRNCTFFNAAKEWGLEDFAKYYCKYVDYKIIEGYNPDLKLVLDDRHTTGKNRCIFRYIMKEENK